MTDSKRDIINALDSGLRTAGMTERRAAGMTEEKSLFN
jgi:hypothetical protein